MGGLIFRTNEMRSEDLVQSDSLRRSHDSSPLSAEQGVYHGEAVWAWAVLLPLCWIFFFSPPPPPAVSHHISCSFWKMLGAEEVLRSRDEETLQI